MTVGRMTTEMSYVELLEWQALDQLRHAELEKERRLAKQGMRPR